MVGLKRLLITLVHPIFLTLDAVGMVSCFLPVYLSSSWHPFFITLGSAFITIGITLPVAVFFQSLQNEQSFNILNACTAAGIESIYISRKRDSTKLHKAIKDAITKSDKISLLGVAFKSFFDQSAEDRDTLDKAIKSPTIALKVLVLDPDCDAAEIRKEAESGNTTIDDINYTINNGLFAAIIERLNQLKATEKEGEQLELLPIDTLVQKLNMQVRTYDSEPVAQVLMFDDTLFSEQYHRGRPDNLIPIRSCIGKYMPVIQYRRNSYGYKFLASHFERIWNEGSDLTEELLRNALTEIYCRTTPSSHA